MGNSSSSTREGHSRLHVRHAHSHVNPNSPSSHNGNRERESEREAQPEPRRETKQEREARRVARERAAREKERERSVREEGVDGGFLVTLGTYVGPEDFNKAVVRSLMIERRLAPFWKGLNDHSESWTENQLVAAVRGLPIPAPDEIPPPEIERPQTSAASVNALTVPITGRSQSYQSDRSGAPSATRPSSSYPKNSSSTNLFRGRAKTLASSFTTKTASGSPAPHEARLPEDPYVNGQPIEAVLYKDAAECPICFLYYPPHLNRTRCCDQPICSECFVQIKRPDPHPPEHHEDPSNPTPPPAPEEEGLLVSEPSACPFCVTPEFGVTYEPPPFRKGLIYSGPASQNTISSPNSAMASTSSLQIPTTGRRRTTSLSASAPQVITTDKVRSDWAKKLADARAHALRRSAAATALHNAAYMLGNDETQDSRGLNIGRRRRTLFVGGTPSGSGSGTPARLPDSHPLSHLSGLILQNDQQADEPDVNAGRPGSRRSRVQDLEDLMMMEAIRMSLASEEERKKKEEKEAKKNDKQKAKDVKKAEKSMKKNGPPYNASMNASDATSLAMSRSSSNLPQPPTSPPPLPTSDKGKAPISANTSSGFNPLSEPTSTLNQQPTLSDVSATSGYNTVAAESPQRHLEAQRANLSQSPSSQPQPSQPITLTGDHRAHLRQLSNASSAASSVFDSAPNSYNQSSDLGQLSDNASGMQFDNGNTETPDYLQSGTPGNGAGLEPMFNFRSLAAMIGDEEKQRESEHNEHIENLTPEQQASRNASIASSSKQQHSEMTRSRGDSGESGETSASRAAAITSAYPSGSEDAKVGAQQELPTGCSGEMNRKHSGETMMNAAHDGQIAQ
ncbi:hypothetical protein AAFC00_006770 [Neodothiora populina]|uniref:Protein sip5 n=1 Tax=Neodothiora populina TaxID=2781224 RepID=A0ABR3PB39_9PEZI